MIIMILQFYFSNEKVHILDIFASIDFLRIQ